MMISASLLNLILCIYSISAQWQIHPGRPANPINVSFRKGLLQKNDDIIQALEDSGWQRSVGSANGRVWHFVEPGKPKPIPVKNPCPEKYTILQGKKRLMGSQHTHSVQHQPLHNLPGQRAVVFPQRRAHRQMVVRNEVAPKAKEISRKVSNVDAGTELTVIGVRRPTHVSLLNVNHIFTIKKKLTDMLLKINPAKMLMKPFNLMKNVCESANGRHKSSYLCYYARNRCQYVSCKMSGKICDLEGPCKYPFCQVTCVEPKSRREANGTMLVCPPTKEQLSIFRCINDQACATGNICCQQPTGSHCVKAKVQIY